ncbi:MAG: hypothetical protein GXP49_11520 [Deltaproteobacteria bacterium]|nr:hypothetical protein [Deltaproteobacteria bacterium]
MAYVFERDYSDMLVDIVFKLSKVFGEKTESVFCSYVYGAEGKRGVKEETGIEITEDQEVILSLIKKAEALHGAAKHILHEVDNTFMKGGSDAKN